MAISRSFLCFALIALSAASPVDSRSDSPHLSPLKKPAIPAPYSLPQSDSQPVVRATAITVKQQTFLYGPGIGGGPFSPTGPLGAAYITNDSVPTDSELAAQKVIAQMDEDSANADQSKYNGLMTLQDYEKLYDNEWQPSSAPTGQDPGLLSNYTQDLLFSMERLSFDPYAVSRLDPQGSLPFNVDDATAKKVSGQTLSTLLSSGRLFYADHRNQSKYERTDKFAAACDAYFYINSDSGNFMPLAIRTNFGKNLIYTPADKPMDWLLAKIMYNVNDFFFGQLYHLASTHYVVETAYEAAIRTLSDDHPVLAILQRLMYGAFGIRPLAVAALFLPGGDFDKYFGYSGSAASNFSADIYFSGFAGAFQSNYFHTNLIKRGLLNATTGPALKNFPFYEDASVIYSAINKFMTTFVGSYYSNAAAIQKDTELQAWIKEANGPAAAIDFPKSVTTPSTLVDMLTHVAHLVSTSHHAVNLNQLITGSALLPFHPTALYKQIPTSKGVTDVVPFLPPLNQCIGITSVAADFSRPLLAGSNRTLINMFNDKMMLARMNVATRNANSRFMAAMKAFSGVVSTRKFGSDGLSQGMPFLWKALDPNVAPWSMTI